MLLLVGGGAFGYRSYRLNQPIQPVFLQFPLAPVTSPEDRAAAVKSLTLKLREAALLARVTKDAGLTKKMKHATDESAASDLGKRVFVELGEADTPHGRVPVVKIGLQCKVKEYNTMLEASTHFSKALQNR